MQFIDLKKQQQLIRSNIDKGIRRVLDHGKYIMGPEVFELEERLADYVGVRNCISCSSGTDALLIPLMAKGIGPGDAILTTPFTYIATAEVISILGATPIFVDIYEKTYNIDPSKIKQGIDLAYEKNLTPKAIIPVDLFGLPARYRLIEDIAKKHDLFIIEDAAQGFGGSVRGIKSGAFGLVSSTSFFPAKPLGGYGDGGAIFTNDDNLASKMKSIRVHGTGKDKYDNVRLGINGRLDTIQAAIMLEKLKIFDKELVLRNHIAEYYLKGIEGNYKLPYVPKGYVSSWAQFSILAKSTSYRKQIIQKLKGKNIPSMIYYSMPLHMQPVFRYLGYGPKDFPIAEDVSSRIFSIPMHPYLNKNKQDLILKVLFE